MNFVRIVSVFTDKTNRTVEELSKVYDNNELLKEELQSIFKGILESKSIRGKKILLKPNWVSHNRKDEDNMSEFVIVVGLMGLIILLLIIFFNWIQ